MVRETSICSRSATSISIKMPENVAFIIDTLEKNGHEAFAVGGCVRDAIMGRIPHDWDITTSAKPEQVKALFRRTIDTGIKHGTVTIMLGKVGYEVTTYRIDGEYVDGRHPKEVIFTDNLIEDLKRRDFTINAMAYNDRAGVVDAFDGISDLENKIIRCVRVATERFTEDALRILRALRFSGQLDFSISDDTCQAIEALAPNLSKISKERIQSELDKLITSCHPDRISLVQLYRLNKYIFEGADSLTQSDTFIYKNIITIMELLPQNHYLRWAALMLYESQPETVLKKLKFDNKTVDICGRLIKAARTELPSDKPGLRRMVVRFGKDLFVDYLFDFLYAISNAGLLSHSSRQDLEHIHEMYKEIVAAGDCISMKDLAIKGSELIACGFEPGKKLGEILNMLFEQVLDNPKLNDYDTLLSMAESYCN